MLIAVEKLQTKTLEDIFASQIEKLKKNGCPETVISKLMIKKPLLIRWFEENNYQIKDDHIPFIPVVPFSLWSMDEMILNFFKIENPYLRITQEEIKDISSQKMPDGPYFILDVEMGQKTLGISPKVARRKIREEGRSGVYFSEMMALAIHSNVLEHNLLHCTETINIHNHWEVPNIAKMESKPVLYWSKNTDHCFDWGAPSIMDRL